jgi:alpha-tubulin suppressor-like RCC1 family protein
VVHVAAGAYHSGMVTRGGTVWMCGAGKYGRLGLETVETVEAFTQVPLPLVPTRPC